MILYANKAWTLLTSIEQHEIVGNNLLSFGAESNIENINIVNFELFIIIIFNSILYTCST
jgi:hypothetical protein